MDPEKYFYTRTFRKISSEKQEKIFQAAISEFALKGYNGASINTIAKRAEISIGSLYSYFSSKETLFLSLIDLGHSMLEQVLSNVIESSGSFYEKLEMILQASVSYAQKYPELNQIYLELSTEGLSHLAGQLSTTMEKITTETYKKIIEKAKDSGELSEDIDQNLAAFCFDNIAMMLQFSFATQYHWERMKLFLPEEQYSNPQRLIGGILNLFRSSFELTPATVKTQEDSDKKAEKL